MSTPLRQAIEEREAVACDLERQATAWHQDVPRVAARVGALATDLGEHDQPERLHRYLSEAVADQQERVAGQSDHFRGDINTRFSGW